MSSIKVKNLVLDYPISKIANFDPKRHANVGGRLIQVSGETYLRAIDDVSLEIESGDRVGVIGHNGAGKSTLLKTLGGIYKPTSGTVKIEGKVAPLFNLKFGMDMSLSGYENIILKALYMGVKKKVIEDKIDDIEALCGLGEFLYLPMKTYSSGMIARLAFAISTKINADILLLDEMIGTGDANFINQTSQIAKNFVQSSNLLIIASHSNKVIREICNKAIVFERGKVVDFTNVNDALKTYNQKSVLNKINSDYLSSRKTKNGKSTLKNYLLVNDTSMSENLGCQAVKRSIDMLFSKRASCIMAVPLGYGSEYFNSIASKSSEWIDKTDGFPKYKDYTSEVDYDSWCAIAKQFRENDKYFNDIENYDFIVVNAEGSIHHNSKRALALLAQIKYLSEVKPLFVLNASVFNIDSRILTDAFKNVQIVHSREGFTYSYLNSLKIASIYSPDLASLYIADLICYPNLYVKKEKRLCLISTGVLNGSDYIASIVNLIRCKGLEAVYLSMSDGNEDSVSIEICNTLGVKHFRANDIPLEHTLNFLTQFDYVVSGRHHLNLFVLATESKLICLPSNTLKVEGTLGFISKNRPMAYSLEQLSSLIDNYSFEVPEKVIKSFSKNIKLNLLAEINEYIESI